MILLAFMFVGLALAIYAFARVGVDLIRLAFLICRLFINLGTMAWLAIRSF